MQYEPEPSSDDEDSDSEDSLNEEELSDEEEIEQSDSGVSPNKRRKSDQKGSRKRRRKEDIVRLLELFHCRLSKRWLVYDSPDVFHLTNMQHIQGE